MVRTLRPDHSFQISDLHHTKNAKSAWSENQAFFSQSVGRERSFSFGFIILQ
jgi:hypothetical protein